MMTMTVAVVIKFIIKSHVETVKRKSPLKLLAKLLLESLIKSLVN